jgi:hypothetical protein
VEIINDKKFWSEYLKGRELGRPRRRCEDNIRMDLGVRRWGVTYRMPSAQARERLVGSCEHGNEPSVSVESGKFLDK